jgi:hypothetical protein
MPCQRPRKTFRKAAQRLSEARDDVTIVTMFLTPRV